MGQKANPIGLRLGLSKKSVFNWYAESKYGEYLHEALKIRKHLLTFLKYAEVSDIQVLRYLDKVVVNICSARPGYVIGKKGSGIESLRESLSKIVKYSVQLNVSEAEDLYFNANLISRYIGNNIKGRSGYKKLIKQVIYNVLKKGKALGIKVVVSGRLGGLEMARTEKFKEGRIPLQFLRADIDYGFSEAKTKYGMIGIKVWLFKGDALAVTNDESSRV